MLGLDPVWTIIVISTLSNMLTDIFGEVLFEYATSYLKDWMHDQASVQAACAAFVMPINFGDAFQVTRAMTPAEFHCVEQFYHASLAMGR